MSELKTNKISTNDGDNVAIDVPLQLKSYTTTERNALTATAGDMIFNTTETYAEVYNGQSWVQINDPTTIDVDFVLVGGGGSAHKTYGTGGGAAGGVISTVDNTGGGGTLPSAASIVLREEYKVTIGAGTNKNGMAGGLSQFGKYIAIGGGSGGSQSRWSGPSGGAGRLHGTGNATPRLASAYGSADPWIEMTGAANAQLYTGSGGNYNEGLAGGGGAGGNGSQSGGGVGVVCNILTTTQATAASVGEVNSTNVYFGGGGGGGHYAGDTDSTNTVGGLGGGGRGGRNTSDNAVSGTANTGGGGGGSGQSGEPGNGGSGVLIVKYPDTYSITVGTGLTSSTPSSPPTGYKLEVITAGTGVISFA
jgi:hypothetical protein